MFIPDRLGKSDYCFMLTPRMRYQCRTKDIGKLVFWFSWSLLRHVSMQKHLRLSYYFILSPVVMNAAAKKRDQTWQTQTFASFCGSLYAQIHALIIQMGQVGANRSSIYVKTAFLYIIKLPDRSCACKTRGPNCTACESVMSFSPDPGFFTNIQQTLQSLSLLRI